jgi:hypothetical protein
MPEGVILVDTLRLNVTIKRPSYVLQARILGRLDQPKKFIDYISAFAIIEKRV